MITINLYHTDSEELIGTVAPVMPIDFDTFFDTIYDSFAQFHKSDEFEEMGDDYNIDDFIAYHNEHSEVKVERVDSYFVQLSKSDIE